MTSSTINIDIKVSNTLVTMATAMISFLIKYKIIFRIMSRVTRYTVGFGDKMVKFVHFDISKFQYF